MLGELGAHARVDAVAGDDEIVLRPVFGYRFDLGLETQLDAELARALLQDQQHFHAPDAGETVAAGDRARALVDHRDIVPVGKLVADRLCRNRVVLRHLFERVVGEHDSPAEGVVGAIALDYGHFVRGIAQFHRDREIKARRPAPETCDSHLCSSGSQVARFRVLQRAPVYADRNLFQA